MNLKSVIEKMEEIEDKPDFDGWDAWAELKDWFVKQKPISADGLASWKDEEYLSCGHHKDALVKEYNDGKPWCVACHLGTSNNDAAEQMRAADGAYSPRVHTASCGCVVCKSHRPANTPRR